MRPSRSVVLAAMALSISLGCGLVIGERSDRRVDEKQADASPPPPPDAEAGERPFCPTAGCTGNGSDGDLVISEPKTAPRGWFVGLARDHRAGEQELLVTKVFNELPKQSATVPKGTIIAVWQTSTTALEDREPIGGGEAGKVELFETTTDFIPTSEGDVVSLDHPLRSSFTKATTQVVYVPQFRTVRVEAEWSAPPWDGWSGGVLAMFVKESLTIATDASISASIAGFRGALARRTAAPDAAVSCYPGVDYPKNCFESSNGVIENEGAKGEGIFLNGFTVDAGPIVEAIPTTGVRASATGGGGAGCDCRGGGGGGHASAGGDSTVEPDRNHGRGGHSVELAPFVWMMGGGGGAAGCASCTAGFRDLGNGRSGGGVVFVRTTSVGGDGTIEATGGGGLVPPRQTGDAPIPTGGGGAGGTVILELLGESACSVHLVARGGNGGSIRAINSFNGQVRGSGGGGGAGHVTLHARATANACPSDVTSGIGGYRLQTDAGLPGSFAEPLVPREGRFDRIEWK